MLNRYKSGNIYQINYIFSKSHLNIYKEKFIYSTRGVIVECVSSAVDRFRKMFGAEAAVDVIEAGAEVVVARFSGHMCYTCGTYDYFEDFAELLSDCGEKWAVESYVQHDDGSYTVTFRPAAKVEKSKRQIKIVIYEP